MPVSSAHILGLVGWLVLSWLTNGFVLAVSTALFTRRCRDAAEAIKMCDAKSRLKSKQPWPMFETELARAEKRTKDNKLSYPRPVRFTFYQSHTLARRMTSSARQEAALKVAMQRKLRCMPSKCTADTIKEFRAWARETLGVNVRATPQTPPDPSRVVPVTLKDVDSCREPTVVKVRRCFVVGRLFVGSLGGGGEGGFGWAVGARGRLVVWVAHWLVVVVCRKANRCLRSKQGMLRADSLHVVGQTNRQVKGIGRFLR